MAIARAYTLRPPNPYHDAGQVMADVYASAVGTTVLQVKEIPPRPARFDGAICLFGLQAGVSEAAVRKALGHCGQIVGCELDRDPAVVLREQLSGLAQVCGVRPGCGRHHL